MLALRKQAEPPNSKVVGITLGVSFLAEFGRSVPVALTAFRQEDPSMSAPPRPILRCGVKL